MTSQRNHYEVLGVPPTATTDQIKKKYRELARKFHPDVVKDKALGQKIFTQVNQAYRILADPDRRAQYDASLRADRPAAASGPTVGTGPANGSRPANGTANGTAPTGPLTAQQTQTVSKLLNDADFALMNSDAVVAQGHCEAALKIDPRSHRALSLLGDALSIQGKRDEAAAAYRRSLEIMPSSMVQAKLSRLETSTIGTRTSPPGGASTSPGAASPRATPPNGTPPRPQPSAGAGDKSGGGLFGRLLGKKK